MNRRNPATAHSGSGAKGWAALEAKGVPDAPAGEDA